jgi:hypothetical protein
MRDPMNAAELHGWLSKREVVVLAVVLVEGDIDDGRSFVVYLHGAAGETNEQRAFSCLVLLPAVIEVRVSDRSPVILHVAQRCPEPGRP